MRRAAVAVAIALLAALYWWYAPRMSPETGSDLDQLWAAARVMLGGGDPYRVITAGAQGPTGPFKFPLYYPLPAVLLISPFSALPLAWARAVYCGVGFGVLAFLLTRRGWWPLVALLSGAAIQTLALAQWSLWLACAVLAPAFGVFGAGKPNAWAAVVAGNRVSKATLYGIAGAAVVTVASFVVQPNWLSEWLQIVRGAPHFAPLILRPFGFLLLLALLRPKDPRARWIAVTTLIPGTPMAYALLPLLVYEWRRRELMILSLLTYAAMYPPMLVATESFTRYAEIAGWASLLVLVPAIGVVLRDPISSKSRQ